MDRSVVTIPFHGPIDGVYLCRGCNGNGCTKGNDYQSPQLHDIFSLKRYFIVAWSHTLFDKVNNHCDAFHG
jgi:hypothetical protein